MIKDRDYNPNNIVSLMVLNKILVNKKKKNILPRMMKAFAEHKGSMRPFLCNCVSMDKGGEFLGLHFPSFGGIKFSLRKSIKKVCNCLVY